jgi:hypothetical protein
VTNDHCGTTKIPPLDFGLRPANLDDELLWGRGLGMGHRDYEFAAAIRGLLLVVRCRLPMWRLIIAVVIRN